jgi:hypothetical protein
MLQEASYHHNHIKTGDTIGIFNKKDTDFIELNTTIYAAAFVTVRISGPG